MNQKYLEGGVFKAHYPKSQFFEILNFFSISPYKFKIPNKLKILQELLHDTGSLCERPSKFLQFTKKKSLQNS